MSLKNQFLDVLRELNESFSLKYSFITTVATILAILIRHPKLNRTLMFLVAILCGILSGFVTSEISSLMHLRGEAENTIAAILGIVMFELIKTYLDRIADKIIKPETPNNNEKK